MRILTIMGTRPEAIKLSPFVQLCGLDRNVEHSLCVSGQHREMLASALKIFDLSADFDLNVMKDRQGLSHVATSTLLGVEAAIKSFSPDWVVVQGDTTTAFAGALAAFYSGVRVAHVEAGLRTGNIASPWPEEANRKLISQIATLHFAPTRIAERNLRREGVACEKISVTGNTVIDALLSVSRRITTDPALQKELDDKFSFLNNRKRLILVTGHRRENFDGGLAGVCEGLIDLAMRSDLEIVYAVHPNPAVQDTVYKVLGGIPSVHLVPPIDYVPFIYLMKRSFVIVTDSGGIQEEAPALNIPVLVTRECSERMEAVDAGAAMLVGTDPRVLASSVVRLIEQPELYKAMANAPSPFGDGTASRAILTTLSSFESE